MADVNPLRYRDWVPFWGLAWLGGWLWASSGPDLSWRRGVAILLATFGPLIARGIRYILVRPEWVGRYRYECPGGHFECSSNDQAAMVAMRDAHQANCEAPRA